MIFKRLSLFVVKIGTSSYFKDRLIGASQLFHLLLQRLHVRDVLGILVASLPVPQSQRIKNGVKGCVNLTRRWSHSSNIDSLSICLDKWTVFEDAAGYKCPSITNQPLLRNENSLMAADTQSINLYKLFRIGSSPPYLSVDAKKIYRNKELSHFSGILYK